MSELDLGSTATPAATATADAGSGRPAGWCSTPPAPVAVVKEEQAAGAVPVDRREEVRAGRSGPRPSPPSWPRMDTRSPEFTKKVDSITSMGDKELRASAERVEPDARPSGRGR